MYTICSLNHKGGVGKTTCAAIIAVALSLKGYKILLIDTDSQGNLSSLFGFDPSKQNLEHSLYSCIENKLQEDSTSSASHILHTDYDNIDILVGNIDLTKNRALVETALSTALNPLYKKIIDDIKASCDYDYVIFDCPPSLGGEIAQILIAVDYVIIPSTTSLYSIKGIASTISLLNSAKLFNPNIKPLGILMNKVSNNSSIYKEVRPSLEQMYGNLLFDTTISRSVIAERMEWNGIEPSNNKIFNAYMKLADEVVNRIDFDQQK